MRKWPYTKLYTPAALSGLCAFCVLHSVWRNYLTQPPQQWVCPYPVFPLAQRLFYSQLKRFVLSLSYPTAMRLCLTLETDCFTFRDPVLTRSTNPVLPLSQMSQYYRPSVQKETVSRQRIHQQKSCLTLIRDPIARSKREPVYHLKSVLPSAVYTWWRSPQRSNQPDQYSITILGFWGWWKKQFWKATHSGLNKRYVWMTFPFLSETSLLH